MTSLPGSLVPTGHSAALTGGDVLKGADLRYTSFIFVGCLISLGFISPQYRIAEMLPYCVA